MPTPATAAISHGASDPAHPAQTHHGPRWRRDHAGRSDCRPLDPRFVCTDPLPYTRLFFLQSEEVERHLYGIENETVLFGNFQHVEMDARIFMSRKPDVPDLACVSRRNESRIRSVGIKNTVRIFITQDLVMLD